MSWQKSRPDTAFVSICAGVFDVNNDTGGAEGPASSCPAGGCVAGDFCVPNDFSTGYSGESCCAPWACVCPLV